MTASNDSMKFTKSILNLTLFLESEKVRIRIGVI